MDGRICVSGSEALKGAVYHVRGSRKYSLNRSGPEDVNVKGLITIVESE